MEIGKAMARIRQEMNLARPEVARMLKITPAALWKIETGKSVPKQKTIEIFCQTFRIPKARLYITSMEPSDFIVEE